MSLEDDYEWLFGQDREGGCICLEGLKKLITITKSQDQYLSSYSNRAYPDYKI
jgi:hypothetical protein